MTMSRLRPAYGGGVSATASNSGSEEHPLVDAAGFEIVCTTVAPATARVAVNSTSSGIVLSAGNSTLIACGHKYGPYEIMRNLDTYVHVQGVAGNVDYVITLV